MPFLKIALLLVFGLGLGACFNDNEERRIVLGNVSLGDQLIDLQKAHEAGAISNQEYRQMREALVNLVTDQDRDDDDDDKKNNNDPEEEDGFSWL